MNDVAPLIRLEAVTKVFQTDEVETHALSGVHLDVFPGEYVAVSGPSGCGKSTLLSILGLLDAPTAGTYLLEGRPVHDLSNAVRSRIRNARIGFIFQAFNLIGDLTVEENVELPLSYRSDISRADRRTLAREALERVEWATACTTTPPSSPAASSSAWRWPGPSPAARRCCSPTSPPATWTRGTARRSWSSWPSCTARVPPSAW